ncbi:MAG: hypothetical protein ACP5P1_11665 [Acidimicrobiales bacterium]
MSADSSDCLSEMHKPRPLSERDIDDFFAGNSLPGEGPMNRFARSARAAASGPTPPPKGELARIFTAGLTIDKGDLPVRAASKVHGPHHEASVLPKWRQLTMAASTFLTGLIAKLGVASAATKMGLIAAVTAGAVTAAGAAGALPAPVQNAVSHAVGSVTPIKLPTDSTTKPAGPATTKPASPGLNGLDQANSTPAAGHAPTTLPTHPNNTTKTTDQPANTDTPDHTQQPTSAGQNEPSNSSSSDRTPASSTSQDSSSASTSKANPDH